MIKDNKPLLDFINSQNVMSIATFDSSIWIANVYFAFAEWNEAFIFLSKPTTKHAAQIINNPSVAISMHWHNPDNLEDRKGLQISGKCKDLAQPNQWHSIDSYIEVYTKKFPTAKNWLTQEYLSKPESSRIYEVSPRHIKFWNDSEFGDQKFEEY